MAGRKEAKQQSNTEDQRHPTEDEIRERAYQIYRARNGDPGDEIDDWFRAEAELRGRDD
jgi:Protein of unknown function (DUF2934)